MSEPWFRRYAGFSYRPVTWQGRVVVAAMAVVAIPLGIASVVYSESQPLLAFATGAVALTAAFVGHIIVFWKIEQDYRRR
jgi:hypothetical protein